MDDYQKMVDKLTRNGHSLPGLACSALDNNVTGFSLNFPGYWSTDYYWETDKYGMTTQKRGNFPGMVLGEWKDNDHAVFLTSDEPELALFTKGGQYERDGFHPNGVMTSYFSVRYVKE